jgi:hypothetical protein
MIIPIETTSFKNFIEFGHLEKALDESEDFSEIEAEIPYANVGLEEKWFKYMSNGEVWRLVRPDPPFKGIWSKVV